MKVTIEQIKAKIKNEVYLVLPNGRTTVCQLTLENGYTVEGYSACVDSAEFDLNMGRKISFEDAMEKIWPLEGYLLAEKMHFNREEPKKTIGLNALQVEAIKRLGKKPHWTQTAKGKKIMAARRRKGQK
jgi:cell division protein YceG involved in septum cleavage